MDISYISFYSFLCVLTCCSPSSVLPKAQVTCSSRSRDMSGGWGRSSTRTVPKTTKWFPTCKRDIPGSGSDRFGLAAIVGCKTMNKNLELFSRLPQSETSIILAVGHEPTATSSCSRLLRVLHQVPVRVPLPTRRRTKNCKCDVTGIHFL